MCLFILGVTVRRDWNELELLCSCLVHHDTDCLKSPAGFVHQPQLQPPSSHRVFSSAVTTAITFVLGAICFRLKVLNFPFYCFRFVSSFLPPLKYNYYKMISELVIWGREILIGAPWIMHAIYDPNSEMHTLRYSLTQWSSKQCSNSLWILIYHKSKTASIGNVMVSSLCACVCVCLSL